MPDKKLTDSEIVKALESYIKDIGCAKCDFKDKYLLTVLKSALALINRLQEEKQNLEVELQAMRGAANSYKAEVERLKAKVNHYNYCYESFINTPISRIKAEAYKEFAEKTNNIIDSLIEKYSIKDFEEFKAICQILRGLKIDTNNLLKEMVGE